MVLTSTSDSSSIFKDGKLKPGIYKIQNLYTETYLNIHRYSIWSSSVTNWARWLMRLLWLPVLSPLTRDIELKTLEQFLFDLCGCNVSVVVISFPGRKQMFFLRFLQDVGEPKNRRLETYVPGIITLRLARALHVVALVPPTMTLSSTSNSSIFKGGKLKPGIYKIQNLYAQTYIHFHLVLPCNATHGIQCTQSNRKRKDVTGR